jgi:hypothetical protein
MVLSSGRMSGASVVNVVVCGRQGLSDAESAEGAEQDGQELTHDRLLGALPSGSRENPVALPGSQPDNAYPLLHGRCRNGGPGCTDFGAGRNSFTPIELEKPQGIEDRTGRTGAAEIRPGDVHSPGAGRSRRERPALVGGKPRGRMGEEISCARSPPEKATVFESAGLGGGGASACREQPGVIS